jgi:hypothetical protein
MAEPNVQQILPALQQWASNPQAAVEQLRPLADAGDDAATAVVAYMLGPQTGRWPEGISYARAAIEKGATFLAYLYGQNLIGQADSALRSQAEQFLRLALDEGWPADPFSALQQAVQQGDTGQSNGCFRRSSSNAAVASLSNDGRSCWATRPPVAKRFPR